MSRINTNVSSMIAQSNLARSNKDMAVRLQRLSTGLAINRGADNPAGLIVSERLRSEIRGVGQAVDNAERASNVISTAEAALQEISTLLTDMKSLIVEAANTGAFSKEEVRANQLQIDSAIESITRISNTTNFAGLKLLNGSLDYVTSGINPAHVKDVAIRGANFGSAPYIPVQVEVLASAQRGALHVPATATSGTHGALLSSVAVEIQGGTGVEVFSFTSGMTMQQMVTAINTVSEATGVTASLAVASNASSGIVLRSNEFGSDAFVSVRKLPGGGTFNTFAGQGGPAAVHSRGEDVLALVNGSLALGEGLDIRMNSVMLNVEMSLSAEFATTIGSTNFDITGGGAKFQIGPSVNVQQQASFGIQSVAASRLGNADVGFLSSVRTGGANALVKGGVTADVQAKKASSIVDAAIDQVAIMRGRLGAFERNTLDTTIRSQQIALENLTASESSIRDADFAAETSKLTRAQILVNAGTSTLALANSTAQSVLSLLG
ncbi:MAG: flagellin [Phycisphaeraceae bacterium]|nr:flagellin [Phycisphaeraceae bacterium]